MTDSPVLVDRRDDGVVVLRLNRPARRNALDSASLAVLNATLSDLTADASVRVLVVSTTDTVALCAGADVAEELDAAGGVARMAAFTRLYSLIEAFPVPTIAVCVGNCVGAGAEIVAGVDLRVGGANLKLAWAGARLGVPVGPARLAPLIGLSRAKDLVFTGRTIGCDEASALGLLNRTASTEGAEAAALELAGQISGQHPDGIRMLKTMFRELTASAAHADFENALLMQFQQHGPGLPRTR